MFRLFALLALVGCAPPVDDSGEEDPSCSGSAVVTLDDLPSPLTEGTTWEEDGVTLTLLPGAGGQFNAGPDPDTGCLWLYLSSVLRAEPDCEGVFAEVDVIDYTAPGATTAAALEDGTEVGYSDNTMVMDPETLFLDGGAAFDRLEVTAAESRICELRIDFE